MQDYGKNSKKQKKCINNFKIYYTEARLKG